MLPRQRLVDACAGAPVVLLVGAAGSGKSVLAGQLADQGGGRTLWCRLAPGYGDAADLVSVACQAAGTDAGDVGVATDVLTLAGSLLEVIEAEPTVLVVDDYDEAEGDRCDQLLAEVAALLPEEASIVVAGRSRPAGLVGRASALGPLVVEAADLAFDGSEAAALFEARGRPGGEAAGWLEATDGWAAALAVGAESGGAQPQTASAESMTSALLADSRLAEYHGLIKALAVLPYVTGDLAGQLGVGSADHLAQLGAFTSLASDADGFWRLGSEVAQAIAAGLSADEKAAIERQAAAALAATDPPTSIDLHLAAGDHEAAARVLADNITRVTADHAMRWLYVMPAELRRSFPPALSGGRATVNLDAAIVEARMRVDIAADTDQRREALLALGSVHAGRGELADAADALDGAARLAAAVGGSTLISTQLAMVRWWAGDLSGAASALDQAGDGVWPAWIGGQLALLASDAAAVASAGAACLDRVGAEPGATTAPGDALLAAAALLQGRLDEAEARARASYQVGAEVGGLDLAAAATMHAWVMIRAGKTDEAQAVVDVLDRQVGRQDYHARVQASLLRRALSAGSGDTERIERDARRVHDYRQAGYAPLEAAAEVLSASTSAGGLTVNVLGEVDVQVDGSAVTSAAWKSKKALEVLLWLSLVEPAGARRERVIEDVWPGREPEKGRTLLRTALSEVRRVLEPNRHKGEPSRFVTVDGDRVSVHAEADVRSIPAGSDGFDLLRPGLAADLPDAEWVDDIRRDVDRRRTEAAERVVADQAGDVVGALEVLVAAEPWNKDHVDALAASLRAAGDEVGAKAVERRWFEDDE